ncbi:MAG: hypothetical protein ACO1OF_16275 [Adhaeribacter sp.]
MKSFFAYGTIGAIILMSGCKDDRNIKKEISDKIIHYYQAKQVQDYKPVKIGKLDTIEHLSFAGRLLKLTGKLNHVFIARDADGSIITQEDTFLVTIIQKAVIVMPEGYQ